MKKTSTIKIDTEVLKRAKEQAIKEDIFYYEIIEKSINEYLKRRQRK